MMEHARRGIDQGEGLDLTGLIAGTPVREEERVIARLDPDNEAGTGRAEVAQVGSVGGQSVLDDDDGELGMLLAKLFQPAAGGIALAVVLGLAVLLDDRLGGEREDFLEVGMDQGGSQQLMRIGEAAAAMVLHQAGGAMDLSGGEIRRAVE